MSWIKIETTLISKPEVMHLTILLGCSEFEVVGHLVAFWSWVDANLSVECPEVIGTKTGLDRVCGMAGMVDALIEVGWLKMNGNLFSVPNIDRHLSKSAKQRALDARRKAEERRAEEEEAERLKLEGQMSGSEPDKCPEPKRTIQDKIRLEQTPTVFVLQNTETQVETPSPVGAGVSSEEDPCDFAILSCNVNVWPSMFAEVRVPSALAIFQNDAFAWAKWLRDNAGPNFDAGKLQKDLQAAVKLGDRFPQAVAWAIGKRKDKLPEPKHDPPKRIDFETWHQMRLTFDIGKSPMSLKDEFGTEALDAWLKLAKRHMNKSLSEEEARRAFAQEFLSAPGIDLANEFFEILGELNNG